MTFVHIIPHTHWDREWYFTFEQARVMLVYFMDELLEVLEKDDEFKYFILDGQAVILEDYLEVNPQNKERIINLVKSGRLIIGPWYTQTDELLVSGESIIRNLYYGISKCKEFGDYMKVGYLPDSFGQSAQIPQLLRGFGIDKVVFWRGLSERHTKYSEFIWKSPDGSEVFAVNMPLGYAVGKYLPHDVKKAHERVSNIIQQLKQKATTQNVLIPNGHDQMPVQKDLTYLLSELNKIDSENRYLISNFDEYVDSVLENKEKEEFDVVEGELTHQKYMRIHRGIYSTRYDLKKTNFYIENLLTNYVEPILTIAYTLGFPYPHGLVEKAWKEILKNHAHDSICSCCTDNVHKDMEARFKQALEICTSLLELNLRKISEAIPSNEKGEQLLIFNTLPYLRSGVVKSTLYTDKEDFEIIDEKGGKICYQVISKRVIDMGKKDRRIAARGEKLFLNEIEILVDAQQVPALGYKTLYIVPFEGGKKEDIEIKSNNAIENEYYKVSANDDGTIDIHDKINDKHMKGLLVFEDSGDAGDEYNYSPPKKDYVIKSGENDILLKTIYGNLRQELVIEQVLNVPKDLEERGKKLHSVEIPIKTVVSLDKGSKFISVKINITNKACDHRLRVLFKTGIKSEVSFADQQFGIIARKNRLPELEVWESENWQEKPVSIYPMQSFVDLHDGKYGFSVVTNGIKEYEIIGEDFDTIAITLFRSVGYVGRSDLLYRPGRPSGVEIETPDSQMLGDLEFELALYPHKGDTVYGLVPQVAKEYLTPMISYQKLPYNVFVINEEQQQLPSRYSLLNLVSTAIMSTIKKSEKEDSIILRIYNPSLQKIDGGEICFVDKKYDGIYVTDLKEDNIRQLSKKDKDSVDIGELQPCQVMSFKFV
ncbi:glycoside hydrolase family 38 [Thermoanaerobacter italicus Ab9]|uniref:Glycoside hydrolase family 38 n=1 Tax=Thermoanaerobacter italicus (strain DSM 9252 / Ab9) TaxID=580331 RepID=D3T797_THEIA|nr:glycoside hydrolase family 38 C-terminal domain-containing protein [Thermoanaerobacter italicus]ADD01829.1 glycoside hydrolase family 38 [Thermoanaerobacter italicus Ab9]